jgi:hypothetical protein
VWSSFVETTPHLQYILLCKQNACKALLELHRQGFKLALEMYDVAVLALLDDYQEVRMEGLDIIL